MTDWLKYLLGAICMFAVAAFLFFGDYQSIENETWLDIAIIALSAVMLWEYTDRSYKKRGTKWNEVLRETLKKRDEMYSTPFPGFLHALFLFCIGVFEVFLGYTLIIYGIDYLISGINLLTPEGSLDFLCKILLLSGGTWFLVCGPPTFLIALLIMTSRERVIFAVGAFALAGIFYALDLSKEQIGQTIMFSFFFLPSIGWIWNKTSAIAKEQQLNHFTAAGKLLDFKWVLSFTAKQRFFLGVAVLIFGLFMLDSPMPLRSISDVLFSMFPSLLLIVFGTRNIIIGLRGMSYGEMFYYVMAMFNLNILVLMFGGSIGTIGVFAFLITLIMLFIALIFKK